MKHILKLGALIAVLVTAMAITFSCQTAKPKEATPQTPAPTVQTTNPPLAQPAAPAEQPAPAPEATAPAPAAQPAAQPEVQAPAPAPAAAPAAPAPAESTEITVVKKTADEGYQVSDSRIFFKPFTADYMDVPQAEQNKERLDKLADMLKQIDNNNLKLVGHAVKIYWWDQKLGDLEQQYILIPLSLKRAQAIAQALADRGVEVARFKTVVGVGASDQIVPDSNLKDRWQNRRVELFLK
jgi:outer membrane protein OmpA-like peptidoglycan-associated protein